MKHWKYWNYWNRCAFAVALHALAALMVACDPPTKQCSAAALQPLTTTPAFGMVLSDYIASAIGLLNEDGELITEAWVDSGTTGVGVSTTLSGDAVLPSVSGEPSVLTYIDRFGVDVITRVSMPAGQVLSQTHAQLPADQSLAAFRANPHDVVALSGGKLLASRYEPNGNQNSPELDRGDDLVVMDVMSDTIETRFDLAPLRTRIGSIDIFARPDRMVKLSSLVVVGTARLSKNFRIAGPGAIAVVDTEAYQVSYVDIGSLTNCGEVVTLDATLRRVVVLCAGITFGNNIDRRADSGLAIVDIHDGNATIETVWRSSEYPDVPVPRQGLIALDTNRIVFVASGDSESQPHDYAIMLDVQTGETKTIAQSETSFVLGEGAWSSTTKTLLIPDAERGIRRFLLDSDSVTELSVTAIPCRNIPARQIRPL